MAKFPLFHVLNEATGHEFCMVWEGLDLDDGFEGWDALDVEQRKRNR
jgi:hypothetical protein